MANRMLPEFRLRSVVLPLIIANGLFFMLQLFIPSFTDYFLLVGSDIFSRPWILLTHMFMHAGFNHIFFNMYGLLLFGPLLESRIGPKRFLTIYLASGLIAAIFTSFAYGLSPLYRALGASAALMGIIGVVIVLLPKLRLLFFFVIPMPLWFAGIMWAAIDTWGLFHQTGIGNAAHLIGMATGVGYGFYLIKDRKKHRKSFASKTHLDDKDVDDYLRSGRI